MDGVCLVFSAFQAEGNRQEDHEANLGHVGDLTTETKGGEGREGKKSRG